MLFLQKEQNKEVDQLEVEVEVDGIVGVDEIVEDVDVDMKVVGVQVEVEAEFGVGVEVDIG
jgi:hypothetical protein